MPEKWAVIVNPVSGNKKGLKNWPEIKSLLIKHNIDFEYFFSESRYEPLKITSELIAKGFRKFISIGGDGTFSEMANGILNQAYSNSAEIILSQIATGTGNDWQKTYGLTGNYTDAVKRIAVCKTVLQDAGKVIYKNNNGKDEEKFFINVAGIGFDALVTNKANLLQNRKYNGKLIYLIILLRSLIKSHCSHCRISMDNIQLEEDIFNIAIGIGKFNGGGMMFCPNALPDDGLFDITLVKSIKKMDVLMNVPKIYRGTFEKHPSVKMFKCKSLKIESAENSGIETDGEYIGTTPATFSIIPECLQVVI